MTVKFANKYEMKEGSDGQTIAIIQEISTCRDAIIYTLQ